MTRWLLPLLLALLLAAGTTPGFSAEEESGKTPVEISNEDREIVEMLELLELLELLNDIDNVAALEEHS